jgi:hypothetical protein
VEVTSEGFSVEEPEGVLEVLTEDGSEEEEEDPLYMGGYMCTLACFHLLSRGLICLAWGGLLRPMLRDM